jgi:hypothetical protein
MTHQYFSPTGNIALIALPSGAELNENFVGSTATASGFGRTVDGNRLLFNTVEQVRVCNV